MSTQLGLLFRTEWHVSDRMSPPYTQTKLEEKNSALKNVHV